jgi:hypothetical protein
MIRMTFKALAGVGLLVAVSALLVTAAAPAARVTKSDIDWNAVGQALGIPATPQAGGVYRIDIPRTDLNVTLPATDRWALAGGRPGGGQEGDEEGFGGRVHVKPAFALGGYLVFLPTGSGSQALMMGDLVLTENEIEPVMLSLEQNGVDVAAIHNHLLWERPTVMYMHLMVMGDAVQLATAVHNALALTSTPLAPQPTNPADQQVDLDTASLDAIIGRTGKITGGV